MQPHSFQDLLKIAVPSGLLAGLVTGLLARLAMRAFALADGTKPTFSIGGTLTVVFTFAVILGIPLALPYVRYWRAIGLSAPWLGIAYGALLLLILVAIPFLLIPSQEATMRLRLIAIGVFLPIPLTYGYALGRIAEAVIHRASI